MPVPKGSEGVRQVMHEYKRGKLRSGSKRGPKVTSRRQALAIALRSSGMSRYGRSRKRRARSRSSNR